MFRIPTLGLIALGCLLDVPGVRADHFAIDLEARVGKASKTAHAEEAAIGARPKPRGVLELKAGDQVTVNWTLTSTATKGMAKDIVVHLFVVKEEKIGQRAVPRLDRDVVVETALTMDFKPKDKAQSELTFTLDKPGSYLLRLETIGAAMGTEGHEHFAALDLLVR